ncbi:hypothetical protein MTR67_034295 [Solanum verrucosum]|uniref:Uncharacterized protein n=1 Tax=Solanum verrucosum TaxID=315347 RepID=A0AAF0ZK82_SOLVR|nr:hypothetical protein MTR67_034295 [Solanum verrucosum]
MSVRLMKKILKEQEPPETQQLINSEDESESPPPSSGTFRNPFDLLDDEDDDDGGVDQRTALIKLNKFVKSVLGDDCKGVFQFSEDWGNCLKFGFKSSSSQGLAVDEVAENFGDHDFKEIVQNSWNQSINGHTMYSVWSKLKLIEQQARHEQGNDSAGQEG